VIDLASEVLGQQEIDRLMEALQSGDTAVLEEKFKEEDKRKKPKTYNFRRPDKFSKDHIRTIQMIHDTFTRFATTTLSAMLRLQVSMRVDAADQIPYEELTRTLTAPTTIAVLVFDPFGGRAIFHIDEPLTYAIIDRLFGGQGKVSETIKRARTSQSDSKRREFTDIEIAVMEGVITRLLSPYRDAWNNVVPELRPRLEVIESNPQFVQIVPPQDMVVTVTITVNIGGVSDGHMMIGLPYLTIEPFANKLSAQYWYSSGVSTAKVQEKLEILKKRLNVVSIPVSAEIGSTTLTMREIMSLKKGDIIVLNSRPQDGVLIKVAGKPKFRGKPGTIGKRLAVKIEKVLEPEEEEMLLDSVYKESEVKL